MRLAGAAAGGGGEGALKPRFIVVAIVLAGGLAAGVWYALPIRRQGGPLTGAEIKELVSGNTIKGTKFSEYYAPNGSIRGQEIEDAGGDEEYLGTWQIDGDRLCVAFPSHSYTGCVSISSQQGGMYDFAEGDQHARRTITPGNPNKL
jgi:hypothetical protein